MRLGSLAALLIAALAVPAVPAGARGERSYRLPELRETAAPAAAVVRRAVWTQLADRQREAHDVTAVGDGVIAFASRGRVCAFDQPSGARRWCAGPGHGVAFAAGEIAYVDPAETLRAVDARTGVERWQHRFGTASPSPSVWGAGTSFLVGWTGGAAGRDASRFGRIDAAGHTVWQTAAPGIDTSQSPVLVPPVALVRGASSGATIVFDLTALRLSGGGIAWTLRDMWVVDLRAPQLVLGGFSAQIADIADNWLTAEYRIADLRTGAFGAETVHVEPDYDENRRLYDSAAGNVAFVQANGRERAHAEGPFVYFSVARKLYRYRLARGEQRPLLVGDDGWFVLGPRRGTVYVERSDGVWSLRPAERAIHARLVAPSRAPLRRSAIVGSVAYFAFEDGRVRGVDVNDGRTMLDATLPGPAFGIASSASHLFFGCVPAHEADGPWQVAAFVRPDAT